MGTIKPLGPCEFEITGIEVKKTNETTLKLSLNDHVRYRINNGKEIRRAPGFDFHEGKRYAVIYSPYPDEPVLEIITLLENEQ